MDDDAIRQFATRNLATKSLCRWSLLCVYIRFIIYISSRSSNRDFTTWANALDLNPSCVFLHISQRIFSTRLCPLPAPPPSPMIFPGLSSRSWRSLSSSYAVFLFSFVPLEPNAISGWLLYPCPRATRGLVATVYSSWWCSPFPPVPSSPLYFCLCFWCATTHEEFSSVTYDVPPLVFSYFPLSSAKSRIHVAVCSQRWHYIVGS